MSHKQSPNSSFLRVFSEGVVLLGLVSLTHQECPGNVSSFQRILFYFYFSFEIFYCLCFYSCPIFRLCPPPPILLPIPTVNPQTIVHVHGSWVYVLWLFPSPSFWRVLDQSGFHCAQIIEPQDDRFLDDGICVMHIFVSSKKPLGVQILYGVRTQ